jgi:hypothetical protein
MLGPVQGRVPRCEVVPVPLRAAALLMALLAIPLGPVAAQSLLDALFGSNGPSRPAAGRDRSHVGSGFSAYDRPQRFDGLFSPGPFDSNRTPHAAYRTLCVRMCDGYYFPISYATDSGGLAHDAQVCASACGGEARLFYHSNPGGDVESMVDLSGRAYASYPTAFKYRQALVEGCQCHPQPWTETELARHRSYAAAQSTQPSAPTGQAPSHSDGTRPPVVTAPVHRPWRNRPAPSAASDWDWLSALGASPQPRSRHRRD